MLWRPAWIQAPQTNPGAMCRGSHIKRRNCPSGYRLRPDTTKKPRPKGRGSFLEPAAKSVLGYHRRPPVEPIVHTCADDVRGDVNRVRNTQTRAVRHVVAQIDVEVFDLCRPVRREAVLQAAADGPTRMRVVAAIKPRIEGADVAPGETTGPVQEHVVPGISNPATRGTESVDLRAAGGAASDAAGSQQGAPGRALDVGPGVIAFDTEHPIAGLPIVADRAADQSAVDIERAVRATRESMLARAPSATAGDTDIEASPVVNHRDHGRRLVDGPR